MRWTATRRPNLTFDQNQKFWASQISQRSLGFKEKILGPLSFQISLSICVRRFWLILLTFKWGELLQKDQIWLLIKNKNSEHHKSPKGHSVSRKKFWDLWVSRSRCKFVWGHFDWFCWPSNEVNCYKKTTFDFCPPKKILVLANFPKVTQFQGNNSGTSEFPDLVANLCEADPDKKIEKALISSRRIGPNDGARLCLLKVCTLFCFLLLF